MNGKCFVDSNIWLYAFMDKTEPKRERAMEIIDAPKVTLSIQVVNEVCCNLLRKAGYAEPEIRQTIDNFQARYPILDVTADIIRYASTLRESYRLSYWDSVVIATASTADCSVVYSEDMQNGLKINGLTIINPFRLEVK